MTDQQTPEKPFEELVGELEHTVERLEEADIGLEEALAVYEEGVKILRECLSRLKSAESKVEMLVKESDDLLRTVPFESGDIPEEMRPASGEPEDEEEEDE